MSAPDSGGVSRRDVFSIRALLVGSVTLTDVLGTSATPAVAESFR